MCLKLHIINWDLSERGTLGTFFGDVHVLLNGWLLRSFAQGFRSDIQSNTIAKGLNEDVIRLISAKKNEPEWMLARPACWEPVDTPNPVTLPAT